MAPLNFDVLHAICNFLDDVSDVLSYSLTCSALRPIAVERRLNMRAISLDGEDSIRNIYNFVFVDERRRGPHIRSIAIPVDGELPDASKELLDRILAVLASATRVHTLSIYVPHGRPCLFNHPAFLPAVAKMTSIQELGIMASMVLTNALLVSTRSALKTFRHDDGFESSGGVDLLLLNIAPQLASTIQEMELSLDFLRMAFRSRISFLAVKSIILPVVKELLDLGILLVVFPALDTTLLIHDYISDFDDDNLAAARARNRAAQTKHAWKGLDRVTATPDMLYALGLTCPIRHLTLSVGWNHSSPRTLAPSDSNMRALLQEYKPTHLALADVRLPDELSSILNPSLFPEDAVSRLTHLTVNADYTNTRIREPVTEPGTAETQEEPGPSWDSIIDMLLAGLQTLRLTHLHIIIDCDTDCRHGPFSCPIYFGARCFMLDRPRVIHTLSAAMRSLTHIFITASGTAQNVGPRGGEGKWEISGAWRTKRSYVWTRQDVYELCDLEQLSTEEREAAINGEGMYPTERTEWVTDRFSE